MYDEIPGLLYLVGLVVFKKCLSKEQGDFHITIIHHLDTVFCKCRTDAHFKPVFRYMRKPLGL